MYSEFRQDWPGAVQHYVEAYGYLQALLAAAHASAGPGGTAAATAYRLFVETARVSELVNLKLLMLNLHQGRMEEAVNQLRGHLSSFYRPPGVFLRLALSHCVLVWGCA